MQVPNRVSPRQPQWLKNTDGEERRVGVEMEIGGMSLATIAEKVKAAVGGVIQQEDPYRAAVDETSLGRVEIEFDALLFSDFKLKGFLDQLPFELFSDGDDLSKSLEKLLASIAARFVPFELVFPPVPISRLSELEAVREALRGEAEGTGSSATNAFGLHLNPEMPDLKVHTALQYLRAFLCLDEELQQSHQVNVTRALSPFIDPFPEEYVKKVLNEKYRPDWAEFTSDYLRDNSTRNRPLDFLPLMAEIDEVAVRNALPEEKINPRPTLHYRLPNCRIDQPDWSITAEWNRWMTVEELVCEDQALAEACRRTLKQRSGSC